MLKLFLLIAILGGCLGFILDYSVRKMDECKTFLDKIKNLKQLLNIPVYATGMSLVYLVTLIPIFDKLSFIVLFCLIGGIICTAVEFAFGYLYNIVLKLNVWDYSHSVIEIGGKEIPLNVMGQIDLVHAILWALISIPIYYIVNILEWVMK